MASDRARKAYGPFKVAHCWISELKKVPSEVIEEGQKWSGSSSTREREKNAFPNRVSLMGVVVAVSAPPSQDTKKPVLYHVDDGTGVIKVAHFMRRQAAAATATARKTEEAGDIDARGMRHGEAFEALLEETKRQVSAWGAPRPVGSCVEVKGRPQVFRGETEVLAFSVRLASPTEELERTARMAKLREEGIYPKDWFNNMSC